MALFEDYIFSMFAAEINSWGGPWVRDVYALGFLISLEDQDLRLPTVGLVYNTSRQWEESTAGVLSKFTDGTSAERLEGIREETKWHFDYWLQHGLWIRDELTVVAKSRYGTRLDPVGASLRRTWIDGLNLWYTDEEEDADLDRTIQMGGQITAIFDTHCVRVAQRLHTEGTIEARFGRAIPIVFHGPEREYHEAWCARDANPSGLAREFEQYVLKGCSPEFLVECARHYEDGRRGAAVADSVPAQQEETNA